MPHCPSFRISHGPAAQDPAKKTTIMIMHPWNHIVCLQFTQLILASFNPHILPGLDTIRYIWDRLGPSTWDPLGQWLQSLHLDKHLLKQQNTKKWKGTKNNCVGANYGQEDTKKKKKNPKTKKSHLKPNCHFWKAKSKSKISEAKAGYHSCHLHTTLPKGWAECTSGQTTRPTPVLAPY